MPIRLHITSPENDETPRTLALSAPSTLVFGRDPGADIRIGDDLASRLHFRIDVRADPARAVLRDLDSKNGLWHNGVRYGGKDGLRAADGGPLPVDLRDGDRIRIGKTILHVDAPDETADDARRADAPESASQPAPGEGLDAWIRAEDEAWPSIEGYRLIRLLGQGGMGRVFYAHRLADGREVAVKALKPGDDTTTRDVMLFKREIGVLKSLRHENVVRYYDDGMAEGAPYLVMEYCDGGTLDRYLGRTGPLPLERAAPLMRQAMAGLAAAHEASLLHRDVKPGNILLAGDPEAPTAKLMDFGLAKSHLAAGLSGFTTTGASVGTVSYLPPEQLSDFKRLTPAADVFSLGATCYRMLAGVSPYDGGPNRDMLTAVMRFDLVPLERRVPGLPDGVTRFFARCLEAEPARRFASAADMLAAFDALGTLGARPETTWTS